MVGRNALIVVVCSFVSPVPDPKSNEGLRNQKIDRKETHDTGDP